MSNESFATLFPVMIGLSGVLFKGDGREIAQSRMAAVPIVKAFEIAKDVHACRGMGMVVLVLGTLGFERTPKTFHDSIIVTVAGAAHAQFHPVVSQD